MKLYTVQHREILRRGDQRITLWNYVVLAESSSEAIRKAQDTAAPPDRREELKQYFEGQWSAEEVDGDVMTNGIGTARATPEEISERKARLAARQSRKEQAK